jgi:hypothetical protein
VGNLIDSAKNSMAVMTVPTPHLPAPVQPAPVQPSATPDSRGVVDQVKDAFTVANALRTGDPRELMQRVNQPKKK